MVSRLGGGHRTESVSLSGRLVHPFADEFFVQWPQAARGAECATRGPFCDTRNACLRLDRSEPPGGGSHSVRTNFGPSYGSRRCLGAAARERRAWALVVPPALFGPLGLAIHVPAAGYLRYWYPVVPIALWMAVLGMSARSERSDTALT
jgi:hypothetical protein